MMDSSELGLFVGELRKSGKTEAVIARDVERQQTKALANLFEASDEFEPISHVTETYLVPIMDGLPVGTISSALIVLESSLSMRKSTNAERNITTSPSPKSSESSKPVYDFCVKCTERLLQRYSLEDLMEDTVFLPSIERQSVGASTKSLNVQNGSQDPSSEVVERWRYLFDILCSLPDKVANRQGRDFNEFFTPGTFYRRLAVQLKPLIFSQPNKWDRAPDMFTELLSETIRKLVRLDHTATLVDAWMASFVQTNGAFGLEWSQIINSLNQTELQPLLLTFLEMLDYTKQRTIDSTALLLINFVGGEDTIQTNQQIQSLLISNAVTAQILRKDAVSSLLAVSARISLKEGLKQFRLICETLSKLIELWSSPIFVKQSNIRYHEYITEAIILSLSLVSSDELHHKTITAKMFHGVELRLGSLVKSIRTFGMATAECFVATQKNGVELNFRISPDEDPTYKHLKDLYSFDWKRVNEAPGQTASEDMDATSEDHSVPEDAEEDDPDEIVDRSKPVRADQETDDDDDESDLEPFDMSETAAALVAADSSWKSLYAGSCISGLKDEKPDTVLKTLEHTRAVVDHESATALRERGIELFDVLVNLRNNYAEEKFDEWRSAAIIGLLLRIPEETALRVRTCLRSREYSQGDKISIMGFIRAAILEFSEKEKTSSPYRVVGSYFFVSLMNAAKNIGFSDDHISRSLLQTLTFIITRSGADPSQPKMAREYIDLLLAFRSRKRAILQNPPMAVEIAVGFFASLSAGTPEAIRAELSGDTFSEIEEWIDDFGAVVAVVDDSIIRSLVQLLIHVAR
ncbi:hypothetical protein BJ742DRAFT_787695 [Cladochytrium replicatum]|nr:hypothetical protein BJ742DRAFT_787695 [Cladochytrium replicatum]